MRAHRGNNRGAGGVVGHAEPRSSAARRLSQARLSAAALERRRLGRDLHDGVQNELVSRIFGPSLGERDRDTPAALAANLSVLRARARATLSAIRDIAHAIRPTLLAAAGALEAIRAQAVLAPITVSVIGTAPRRSEDAEAAVYFACVKALQNVAKRARRSARVPIRVRSRPGGLAVRIDDDGGGFVRARAGEGTGLSNIRDRLPAIGGRVRITSTPGRGTVMAITPPWPLRPVTPTTVRATSPSTVRGPAVTERAARRIAQGRLRRPSDCGLRAAVRSPPACGATVPRTGANHRLAARRAGTHGFRNGEVAGSLSCRGASPAPPARISSRARRGRTPTSRASAPASVTSSWPSSRSPAWPKPERISRTGARTKPTPGPSHRSR
jgi:hypothetical protein